MKIGVSNKTVSAYETGRTPPPLKILNRISYTYDTRLFGLSTDNRENLFEKLSNLQDSIEELKGTLSL